MGFKLEDALSPYITIEDFLDDRIMYAVNKNQFGYSISPLTIMVCRNGKFVETSALSVTMPFAEAISAYILPMNDSKILENNIRPVLLDMLFCDCVNYTVIQDCWHFVYIINPLDLLDKYVQGIYHIFKYIDPVDPNEGLEENVLFAKSVLNRCGKPYCDIMVRCCEYLAEQNLLTEDLLDKLFNVVVFSKDRYEFDITENGCQKLIEACNEYDKAQLAAVLMDYSNRHFVKKKTRFDL